MIYADIHQNMEDFLLFRKLFVEEMAEEQKVRYWNKITIMERNRIIDSVYTGSKDQEPQPPFCHPSMFQGGKL